MARNLVQEKREEERAKALEVADSKVVKKEEATESKAEEKVVYITTEQVTLNNLNVIMAQLDILYTKMLEGFKQVGVTFEDSKEK